MALRQHIDHAYPVQYYLRNEKMHKLFKEVFSDPRIYYW